MANVKIKRYNPSRSAGVYGYSYRPMQLTYQILDGLYDRTILKEIIQTFIANIIPPFYTLTIEDIEGNRLSDLEKECKDLSRIIDRTYMAEVNKAYFLYGTALSYTGNRDKKDNLEEIFLLHPRDVSPEFYSPNEAKYGEIKFWRYTYGNKTFEIPPDDIKVYANDPAIGEIYGHSIVNHMQDTLAQFLNNRFDLAEILNRYAIPIVQWAVDVSEVPEQRQDTFISRVKKSLQQQFIAGDDLITDSRIEPRTLSFAADVGHLIQILDASRKDLGMLGVPESLMGGQISNLSGGKTQAAVFMTKVGKYRAIHNDYLAKTFYIPFLEKKGHVQGTDFHNVYIAFPPATTELPSDSIIWVKTAIEMGLITPSEGRMVLGFRGNAPGVTKELEEIFKVRSIQYNNEENNGKTDQGAQKTKVDEPKDRSGKDPDKEKDSVKKTK